jgi:hypothetical protein
VQSTQPNCFASQAQEFQGLSGRARLSVRCWFGEAERNTGRCESRFVLPGHRPRESSAVAQGPRSLVQAAEEDAIRFPHGNLQREAPPDAKVGCVRRKRASKRLLELDAQHEKLSPTAEFKAHLMRQRADRAHIASSPREKSIAQQLKKRRLKEPAGPLPGIRRAQEGSNRTPSAQLRAMTLSGDEKWPTAGVGCPRREDS